MKKYIVSWSEEVSYDIEVKAESKEKAKDMLFNGEIDMKKADTNGTNLIDGSVEVEEVEK